MPPRPGLQTLALDLRGAAPDAVTVDVLARLQLGARPCGWRIALRGAPRELLDLVALMGLADVLPEEREVSGPPRGEIVL
jgi:ABC-type transporter Mla MlaB component